MAKRIFTTDTIDYGHYGYAAYRIEIDLTEPKRPFQRHIWTKDGGAVQADDWIASMRCSEEELLRDGFRLVEQRAA